jgi:hypothetical protein
MRELVARIKKSLLAAAVCAAVAALSAGPALAGEVTGSGANEEQNQGMSWCSFSGLNDDPARPSTAPARTAPAASRSRSGRRTGSVSRTRAWRIPAPPAIRTARRCRRSRTGTSNEAPVMR